MELMTALEIIHVYLGTSFQPNNTYAMDQHRVDNLFSPISLLKMTLERQNKFTENHSQKMNNDVLTILKKTNVLKS